LQAVQEASHALSIAVEEQAKTEEAEDAARKAIHERDVALAEAANLRAMLEQREVRRGAEGVARTGGCLGTTLPG
jgi:hypothetical protein